MAAAATQSNDEIKARKIEMVLEQLDHLPTLPAVATRLLALTGTPDSKIHEVTSLLSADPALTSKLLSLASSAGSGARGTITTVQQAVVRLGFDTVRNLVLSVKVFEAFLQRPNESADDMTLTAFSRVDFWKHSLAVGTAAELLASRCKPRVNPQDAFVCGLLHDLGKVAFDTIMPKSFDRVMEAATLTRGDVSDVERRILGMDHGVAGKRLAESWNLPQLITQAIWLHGAPPQTVLVNGGSGTGGVGSGLVNPAMVALVGLSDILVRRQHIGFSGNYLFPYEVANYLAPLGLTDADIREVTSRLNEELEQRAQAIGLYDVESRQLYLESIANANAELGRVNQQLATQNRRLAMRSTCFEMMTKVYQRIVPASSPAQLLKEIGAAAHPFLDARRLVLFSQDPEGNAGDSGTINSVGEVMMFDPTKEMQDSFLMNMPLFGGDQRIGSARGIPNGQNFSRPALPQLDWLMPRVAEFLGTTHCWFMPLLCGNEPIGGIIWIAKDHENSMTGISDLLLVSQAWGMTLRTSQIRERQMVLMESLAASNRERGQLQQQLVRAKSLASLGEMAAGAAHEMNNPLAVVCGRAQLLAAKLNDATMKQEAALIAAQGDRLSQIITDMMEFAKPVPPQMATVNYAQLVREAMESAESRVVAAGGTFKPDMVKVEISPDLPTGFGDARQLRNALMEIIVNAVQASKGEPSRGAEVMIQVRFDALDSQMIVQVIDRGIGMTDDVMHQAFAPFFSAKTAGRNRGMGLAKALRWVENHGGTIRLDSAVAIGTTAVVILPTDGGRPAVK